MSDTPADTPTWSQKLGATGYRLMCGILRLIDIRLIALSGRIAGYLLWLVAPSRRHIVARNLRIAVDPMLKGAKLSAMVRRNIVRTTMNMVCALKTGLMNDREFAKSITVVGRDFFEQSGMNGSVGISCIPHAGNWEILARIRPCFPKVEHYGSMYRRLANPLLEKLVKDARTGYGCMMFSKEDGLKEVLKLARTGGLLGVLCDQYTQEGLFLPYFGKVTGVTPLPALLYKRSRGKGKLISVFTRNTALGKWDAVMNREIVLPEGCDSMAAITYAINEALERCQNENILDGLWMHHRWKTNSNFAPPQPEDVEEVAKAHTRLPFRIIVCMPERLERALDAIVLLRGLKRSRFDAQIIVACSTHQREFWQQQTDCVDHLVTTDGTPGITAQLEADELYREGPYDYLFMLSEEKKLLSNLKRLGPLFISGFQDSPLARRFRLRFPRLKWGPLQHGSEDYIRLLRWGHGIEPDLDIALAPIPGNDQDTGCYLAPFSSLGEADRWEQSKWTELSAELAANGTPATLLAEPKDEDKARQLAEKLAIPSRIIPATQIPSLLGTRSTIYAVDGILPQIASLLGAHGAVIMASRLGQRIYGERSKLHPVFNHLPCHPCGLKQCDAPCCCTQAITVQQLLKAAQS